MQYAKYAKRYARYAKYVNVIFFFDDMPVQNIMMHSRPQPGPGRPSSVYHHHEPASHAPSGECARAAAPRCPRPPKGKKKKKKRNQRKKKSKIGYLFFLLCYNHVFKLKLCIERCGIQTNLLQLANSQEILCDSTGCFGLCLYRGVLKHGSKLPCMPRDLQHS